MLQAWRIVKQKHSETAFTGEGAAMTGGRWNSRGLTVIYCSGNMSLAALETLIHLNPKVIFQYHAFSLEFEARLVEKIPLANMPDGWMEEPPSSMSKVVGDRWVREARSAVLEVPSVIIPNESNYLLNPAHPDYKKITIRSPQPFKFDFRLLN